LGDKATEDEKQPILDALEKLKETVKSDDIDAIKEQTEELAKVFYPLSEKLYKQAAETAQTDGGVSPDGEEPDIIVDDGDISGDPQ
jgi:molecular chaperone DnaK